MTAIGYLIGALSSLVTYYISRYFGAAAGAAAGSLVAVVGGRVLHLQPSPAVSNVGDP